MFRKSKVKIVAAILFFSVAFLAGILGIIYGTSYGEVYRKNQEMLARYIEAYKEKGNPKNREPEPELEKTEKGTLHAADFYSVKVFQGEKTEIDSGKGLYTNEELEKMAFSVAEKKKTEGVYENMVYRIWEGEDYILVAFMDNTIIKESVTVLFKHTLIFGSAGCVFVLIISVVLAEKIMKPLKENYNRQKQFVSDAGHELKTPVAAIKANLSLLLKETGENRWLSNISYETKCMEEIVGQLLDLAQAENGKIQKEQVDFYEILMGEILAAEIPAFEKGIFFDYADVKQGVTVTGNEQQLRRLVSILVDNAVEHSEPEGRVLVSLGEKRGKLYFSVENKGAEIPREEQEKIFQRFYRADKVRTGGQKHYGLGLAIAKAITDSSGGSISVKCENGNVKFLVIL